MIFEKNDTLVFAGDSVTDAGKTPPYGEEAGLGQKLGDGYVHIISDMLSATYPEIDLRILNCGVAGNTSSDLLRRWDSDVLSFNPERICICIGINDVVNKFIYPARSDMQVSREQYEENLEKMVDSAKNAKSIFIISPFILESENDTVRKEMDIYRGICRKVARKYSCKFIDIQKTFDEYCVVKHRCIVAWDRIHPNGIGAYIIARGFLNEVGFDFNHLPGGDSN